MMYARYVWIFQKYLTIKKYLTGDQKKKTQKKIDEKRKIIIKIDNFEVYRKKTYRKKT